jgi:hypothetical protein
MIFIGKIKQYAYSFINGLYLALVALSNGLQNLFNLSFSRLALISLLLVNLLIILQFFTAHYDLCVLLAV